MGSPRPRRANAQASASRLSPSTLLATTSVGPAGSAQQRGDLGVLLGDADGGVDDSRTTAASRDGPLGLGADLAVEAVAAGQPAAGVDDGELAPGPLGVEELAVPGHARALLDDGLPPADDAVDQGGLADVGPPDDGDQGRPACGRAALIGRRGALRHGLADRPRAGRWRRAAAQGGAVGGDDLDRAGQVLGAEPVEEPTPRQADVGQEVAAAVGLRRRAPGPGRRRSEPGDRDVAPEELVVDRRRPRRRASPRPAAGRSPRRRTRR